MAFPLGTVLAAAPGIISAAADIIKLVRNRKTGDTEEQTQDTRLDDMMLLIEKQAVLIEEMARQNKQLALAVQNNRMLAMVATAAGVIACLLVFFQA